MDKSFYRENRRRLAAHLTGNEAMLFFSGESLRKSGNQKKLRKSKKTSCAVVER